MSSPLDDALAFNIFCIDTDYIRPRLACSYLITHGECAAFIDCGTQHSVVRLLGALNERGLNVSSVKYVIPTHIHLDHAGGAGELMQALPNATCVVHPRGARHMIDPQRLVESACQVYGRDRFNQLYGNVIPVSEQRVHAANDGEFLDLNGRKLIIADTPGHARHHFCVFDEMSEGWFTGDTFGLSYPDISIPGGRYLMPTTTPVQFEPDAWLTSLETLLGKNPQRMYLTHYGAVENVPILAQKLRHDLEAYTRIAYSVRDSESRLADLTQQITRFTLDDLIKAGCRQDEEEIKRLLSTDLTLNAQGLDIWLKRQEKIH